jgi:hypothetical protein
MWKINLLRVNHVTYLKSYVTLLPARPFNFVVLEIESALLSVVPE